MVSSRADAYGTEIYPAISGESRFSGWPCTLVRLTGCHLRCVWCDSEHSFTGGQTMAVTEILAEIQGACTKKQIRHIIDVLLNALIEDVE